MNAETELTSLQGCTRDELRALCAEHGQPGYRGDQIWDWLQKKWAESWDEMRNLPGALRDALTPTHVPSTVRVNSVHGDPDGTRKLLIQLADGDLVETVIILAKDGRRTVCLSSQVGCKFGCVFCASGQAGFMRNLTAGEIMGSLLAAVREMGQRPTNIVFMGIGEPLDNYDAVLKAVRIMNDAEGLQIGARKITISTVGVIPGIERLAEEGLQVELSVSLHNARDVDRDAIMPINRRYPVAALMDTCSRYVAKTGRIITFEYTMIAEDNDTPGHAHALAEAMRPFQSRVNLIRLNPIDEYAAKPSDREDVDIFMSILRDAGINVTFRDSRGRNVAGACGQLRVRQLGQSDSEGDAQPKSANSSEA